MYYPILRGRQNELLAIKELLESSLLSEKVIPIIEPVRLSPTLINTLNSFNKANHDIALIRNPQVGSFFSDSKNSKNQKYVDSLKECIKGTNIKRSIIVDSNTPSKVMKMHNSGVSNADIIAICKEPDSVKFYEEAFDEPVKTIVPYEPAFRRIRNERIILEDNFNKQTKNADYENVNDEFFSDEHLYYKQDGYIGFSDYSIIGNEYNVSGFAPRAVVIHIVYFDNKNELRIKHFVSDDKEDTTDPASKFYQAVVKLKNWNAKAGMRTKGIQIFEKICDEQSYPGLGVVKKLSIMHHLELMSQYLDREEK